MRQETNNEMDLLLRRLSRRQDVPLSDVDSHNDSDHLDADELSSYAENVLPAAARARYTDHLAECSRCRELVVQLSASVPVAVARETVTVAEVSGLRKFLASFFSPMVLRYAVPALGLIVVAAIGFIVFRSSSRSELARLDQSTQNAPAPAQTEQPPASTFNDSQPPTNPQSRGVVSAGKTVGEETKPAATPNAQPATADKNEAARNEPPPTAERQPVANAAPPSVTVTAAPSATIDEVRVDVEGRRVNELPRVTPGGELAKQKASEDAPKEQEKKTEVSAARRAAKTPAAAPQSGGAGSAYMVDGAEKDKKDDGVMRSAGGRRFRKQNGMWVDTAYDSASQIINVSRNSEQYRALIADEPTIKSIAEELDGTVIVVLKGRTYRIR